MDNSIEQTVYTLGATAATAQKITLSNYYCWEIRINAPLGAAVFNISPQDPALDDSNVMTIEIVPPLTTPKQYILMDDSGSQWITGHAEVWIYADAPQDVVVWGVRRN